MGVKYIWNKNMYYGEKAEQHKKLIKFNMAMGRVKPNTYVITPAHGKTDMLDIYSAVEFKQKIYNNSSIHVLGIAKSKDEALELVKHIVEDMYTSTGGFDIKSFFEIS